jgi:cytochrome P450
MSDAPASDTIDRGGAGVVGTGATSLNPFEPGFFDNPYAQYRALRDRHPVHRTPLGAWTVLRYDDVLRVLRDPELSVEDRNARVSPRNQLFEELRGDRRRRGDRGILNIDPPDHTRLRRLVSKAFTPNMVRSLRPRVQQLVDGLLDEIAARGATDLIHDLAFPLPFAVISELLGMPESDRDQLRGWSHTMTATLDPIVTIDQVRAALDASDHMLAHVLAAIEWKRTHPADDLLTALLAAEDDGDMLTEEELLDQVVLLYIAGHETTVNLIGNGTLTLLRNRAQLERWQADPALEANAVEELLRYESPVQFSRRITVREIEVAGHTIEPGSFLMTCLGSANRDELHWGDDADGLDLTRAGAAQHVSFGSGVHHCLGSSLARVEAQVAIGTLIRRFPRLELATDTPDWNGRIILRGLESLPLALG